MHRLATRAGQCPVITRGCYSVPDSTLPPDTVTQYKFQFFKLMTGVTFLSPNKKVTKEIGIGGSFLQRRPLLYTTPPKPGRPAEFPLSSQVSRLAACRIMLQNPNILPPRQGGESGVAAISRDATMCRHVVRAPRSFFVATGGVHRGGCIMSRGSAALMPPLCRLLLALFLPKQEKGVNGVSLTNSNLVIDKQKNTPENRGCRYIGISKMETLHRGNESG